MTEARKIRHSYGCVKDTDIVALKRKPKVTAVVESILGRETRKFYIVEVDVFSREDEEGKKPSTDPFEWTKAKPKPKPKGKVEMKRKVLVDVITGTMYDFETKECLSSTKLKIVD
jgi:hypothetical protein